MPECITETGTPDVLPTYSHCRRRFSIKPQPMFIKTLSCYNTRERKNRNSNAQRFGFTWKEAVRCAIFASFSVATPMLRHTLQQFII